MNPRIKELAEQCTETFTSYFDGRGNVTETYFNKEKFAQLIIQKCIEEAGDPADGLILDDTWHDGVRASVWSIQQYFGVEEQEQSPVDKILSTVRKRG